MFPNSPEPSVLPLGRVAGASRYLVLDGTVVLDSGIRGTREDERRAKRSRIRLTVRGLKEYQRCE
jgi:hypothetical protein